MEKEALNPEIHQKIIDSSKLLLKKEWDKSTNIIDALDWLNEIATEADLNQVSDIYIYEEGFGDTHEELKNTIVHAIASVIASEYTDENLIYLETIAFDDDSKKSDIATDYLLKIGRYQPKFQDHVLALVEQNIDVFSINKLNIIAFYLFKIYKQDDRVVSLFKEVKAKHDQKKQAHENSNKQVKETDQNVNGSSSLFNSVKKIFRKN